MLLFKEQTHGPGAGGGSPPDSEGFINLLRDWKFLAEQVGGRTKTPKLRSGCGGTALQRRPRGRETTSTQLRAARARGVTGGRVTCVDGVVAIQEGLGLVRAGAGWGTDALISRSTGL